MRHNREIFYVYNLPAFRLVQRKLHDFNSVMMTSVMEFVSIIKKLCLISNPTSLKVMRENYSNGLLEFLLKPSISACMCEHRLYKRLLQSDWNYIYLFVSWWKLSRLFLFRDSCSYLDNNHAAKAQQFGWKFEISWINLILIVLESTTIIGGAVKQISK